MRGSLMKMQNINDTVKKLPYLLKLAFLIVAAVCFVFSSLIWSDVN